MKSVMILSLIVSCAIPAQLAAAQQPSTSNQTGPSAAQQKREGAITGRVIGPDGQPMAGAEIFARRISERSGSNRSATSDDNGDFKLTGLSPGAYVLNASAPGYINAETSTEDGIHRIGESVTINLVKGGVITGRVTDEAGEPMVGVRVFPQRLRDLEGKAASSRFDTFDGLGWMTDDRGIYRVYGLPPGVYVVSVGAGYGYSYDEAQISRDAPTYYPSATRDTAGEISLRGGEEVSGIDIRHRGERGHIVSGVISGDIESAPPYSQVSVTLRGIEAGLFKVSGTTPNSRGFAMYGVPDGEYELAASRWGGDREETFSSTPRRISVKGADVIGVELKL
ncbi:MAG: carboxypeptidase regulatory-like domain-containing protein, partial [Blastocatellia bacterium]